MSMSRVARIADVLVVVLLAGSAQIQVWTREPSAWQSGPAVNAALAAVATMPLLARRRHALLVLSAVAIAGWLQYELDGDLGQPFFALVLALYSVAAHANRTQALLGGGVVGAAVLWADVPRLRDGAPWDDVVPAWFVLAALWGFGRWMRRRRREVQELHERTSMLELTREEDARAAVAAERARIARELHDLVAHSMGVIVIQSQAAQRVLRHDPTAAEQALTSIESTGRQGMAEMRRLLDVLIGAEETAPLAPQPGLQHLDALVEKVRSAGLPVDVSVRGEQRPLPPGVDLAAYRIVQESLTNTLRHAGVARASVSLRYHRAGVDVEVSDDGRSGEAPGSTGRGLIGMRERVALYGGTLDAGPRSGGGFLVRASLPVESPDKAPA
jgi:signal transduction histidine kinase